MVPTRFQTAALLTASLLCSLLAPAVGAQSDPTAADGSQAGGSPPYAEVLTVDGRTWDLNVTDAGAVRVALVGGQVEGDVLRVYGPDSALVAESVADAGDQQQVAFLVPAGGGAYLVRVERDDGATAASGGKPLAVVAGLGVSDPSVLADPSAAAAAQASGGSIAALPSSPAASAAAPPAVRNTQSRAVPTAPAAPHGKPTLSLVKLDPPPGTLLQDPLDAPLERLAGGKPTPGSVLGPIAFTVAYDTGGRSLALIGLLDRGAGPVPIGPGLDAGGGADAVYAFAAVDGSGTRQLSTNTMRPFRTRGLRTTRLRVRLCDAPQEIDGLAHYGDCYAEAVSGDYPLEQRLGSR